MLMTVRTLGVLALVGLAFIGGCATGLESGADLPPGSQGHIRHEVNDALRAVAEGKGSEALTYYERQATLLDQGDDRLKVDAARAYIGASIVARLGGLYQKGIRYGLRARELLENAPVNDEILMWRSFAQMYLGYNYAEAGDLNEARRQFAAVRLLSGGFGPEGSRISYMALALNGVSMVAYRNGDYAEAAYHAGEAVRLVDRWFVLTEQGRLSSAVSIGPPVPPRVVPGMGRARERLGKLLVVTLTNLGMAEFMQGNAGGAERSLHRALEIAEQWGATEFVPLARAVLSDLAYRRGDTGLAEHLAEQAVSESKRQGLSLAGIWALSRRGARAAQQGRHEAALPSYREAIRLVEETRSRLEEAGLRRFFVEDKQELYQGAARSALALELHTEAFAYSERARARAFLDLLGNSTVVSKGRTRALVEEEVHLRAQLAEAKGIAQGELGAIDPSQARQKLDSVEQAYRAFLDRVRRENLEQASLMAVEPVNLRDVQGLLPPDATLLEYLVTDQEILLWILGRTRFKVLRLPVARPTLVGEVRALRESVGNQAPLEVLERRARALYDRLLAPARPHLRGDSLLIVPHDVLHYLPFGALRTPEGRWLIEDFTVSTLPSASVLKYLQEKGAGAGTSTLALGNPDVGPALYLRYGEREARLVGARYPGATVLLRQDATEAKMKALGEQAGILHFATHGELSEKDPLSSALLLVPDGKEDGRLEVREIFGLDLKAKLVVLSACETGLGQLSKGDELVGLQRAFLYAGTPAVVTTLWKVDDRASYFLMRSFYDHLGEMGPAAALRAAQRDIMRDFPHPFAWAGFGVTGVPK